MADVIYDKNYIMVVKSAALNLVVFSLAIELLYNCFSRSAVVFLTIILSD